MHLTGATISDIDALERELQGVRQRGYAVNFGESVEDVHAVGLAFYGPVGAPLAAITVSAPARRLDDERATAFAPLLRRAADAIVGALTKLPGRRALDGQPQTGGTGAARERGAP